MKGCAQSVLIYLGGLLAAIAALSLGLQRWRGFDFTDTIGVSLLGGFFLWVSASLLLSAATAWRDRSAIAGGLAGVEPTDGRRTILSGRIEPLGPALRAPFSGRECVAYTFEIYAMVSGHRRPTRVVYYDGVALTPSTIVTRAGSFRLLAVPELDCDESPLDSASKSRAAEFVRTAAFEVPTPPFTRPSVEAQWSDDDGEYRRLRNSVECDDLEKCQLSERALERGAPVCVFGHYSAAKRAIVADPSDWSKITRVMKGDADSIVKQLGSSVMWRGLWAVVTAALGLGAVAAFVS